jgi:predicted nucleic acid-binding protein
MIVVSDTSALSNLALVDHLWLLEAVYQVVMIPDVVARELYAGDGTKILAVFPGCSVFLWIERGGQNMAYNDLWHDN